MEIDVIDAKIREHLQRQAKRLVDAGYKNACIEGKFSTIAEAQKVVCFIQVNGFNNVQGSGIVKHGGFSLLELPDAVTKIIDEMPEKLHRDDVSYLINLMLDRANIEDLEKIKDCVRNCSGWSDLYESMLVRCRRRV